jgi:hypothetical protein
MKACARATGANKTAPTATAAAIHFELVSIILPRIAPNVNGAGPGVNPSLVGQT